MKFILEDLTYILNEHLEKIHIEFLIEKMKSELMKIGIDSYDDIEGSGKFNKIFYLLRKIRTFGEEQIPVFCDYILKIKENDLELKRKLSKYLFKGPDIDWKGSDDFQELQRREKYLSDNIDLGYMSKILDMSVSVCRIDFPEDNPIGTGFLIAKNIILTNYHVLKKNIEDDIEKNAAGIILRFGLTSTENPKYNESKVRPLPEKAILASSSADKLDYVLIQTQDCNLKPLEYVLDQPQLRESIVILHHPEGKPMSFAPGINSVEHIDAKSGKIQYWTSTSHGSSGAPCFNQELKVVALHHSERLRYFGTIREGILLSSIYEEIKQFTEEEKE